MTDEAEAPAEAVGSGRRRVLRPLFNTGYGIVLGIANVIPGVSGGTILVVLGLYERLIEIVGRFGEGVRGRLDRETFHGDLRFLAQLVLGAVIGIALFSSLIMQLFSRYPEPTYFLFIGLIAGSVPLIYRKAAEGRARVWHIVPLVIAVCAVVLLPDTAPDVEVLEARPTDGAVLLRWEPPPEPGYRGVEISVQPNGSRAVFDASQTRWNITGLDNATSYTFEVSARYERRRHSTGRRVTVTPHANASPVEASEQSDGSGWSRTAGAILSGAMSAGAMVIPGMSGSFILILLGTYQSIIGAVNELTAGLLSLSFSATSGVILGGYLLGVLVGLGLITKLINFLLTRHRAATFFMILGLMIGSIVKIWPGLTGSYLAADIATVTVGTLLALVFGREKVRS